MSPDLPDLFVLRGFVALLQGDVLGAKNDMTKSLVGDAESSLGDAQILLAG